MGSVHEMQHHRLKERQDAQSVHRSGLRLKLMK